MQFIRLYSLCESLFSRYQVIIKDNALHTRLPYIYKPPSNCNHIDFPGKLTIEYCK